MSSEYKKKIEDRFAVLDQAAAFRRGASELSATDREKLEELKETLRKSGSEAPAKKKKTVQQ